MNYYLSLIEAQAEDGGLFTINGSQVNLSTLVNVTILLTFLAVTLKWMILPTIVSTIERVVNGKIDSIAVDIALIKAQHALTDIRLAQGTEKFEFYDAFIIERRESVATIHDRVSKLEEAAAA